MRPLLGIHIQAKVKLRCECCYVSGRPSWPRANLGKHIRYLCIRKEWNQLESVRGVCILLPVHYAVWTRPSVHCSAAVRDRDQVLRYVLHVQMVELIVTEATPECVHSPPPKLSESKL